MLCPIDPSVKGKSQVYLCASWAQLVLEV